MNSKHDMAYKERINTRDLSFCAAIPGRAKTLSTAQVEAYNRDGYLKPFRIFNDLEAVANRAYFDYLLAALNAQNDGRDSYSIIGYHSVCEGIHDIAVNPRILDLVEDIIGPNVIAWGTHFFCKLPRDPKSVPWHQDASYWPFERSRTVTVWLAIDDADETNSALKVIPGTHARGLLKWDKTRRDAVIDQEITDIQQYGEPVSINLRAGEIELHADMIAHGSEPNRSDRRRCGLVIRYCPPEVVAIDEDWYANSIICRGTDPTGRWADKPRPCGNDLSPLNKPKPIGGN